MNLAKTVRNAKGFTMIELIMVIVILGILAAVAIPKFVDLKSSAHSSVASGVTGALAGAITMLHSKYILNAASTYDATSVVNQISTQGVTLLAGAAAITATIDSSGPAIATWSYTGYGGAGTPAILGAINTSGF